MSKFSEYIKSEHSKTNSEELGQNKKSALNNNHADVEKLIDKYSSYSKDNLMSEFLKLTLEKKKRGELKESDIEMLKSTLAPMLTEEQKCNLNDILEMVRNVK